MSSDKALVAEQRTKTCVADQETAYMHLVAEVGTKEAARIVRKYNYPTVTAAIHNQRKLLLEEKIITVDEPYPTGFLDLSAWREKQYPAKKEIHVAREENKVELEKNKSQMIGYLSGDRKSPDFSEKQKAAMLLLQKAEAENPNQFADNLSIASNALRCGVVHKEALPALGVSSAQMYQISKQLGKETKNLPEIKPGRISDARMNKMLAMADSILEKPEESVKDGVVTGTIGKPLQIAM